MLFRSNLPVIPVVSLDAIAMQLIATPRFQEVQPSHFVVAIDARMDEVYWARYQYKQQGDKPVRVGDIHLSNPEHLDLEGIQYLAGSAIRAYGNRLFAHHHLSVERLDADIGVSALGILSCAVSSLSKGEHISVQELQPLYVRNKVALTTQERDLIFNQNN